MNARQLVLTSSYYTLLLICAEYCSLPYLRIFQVLSHLDTNKGAG